MFDPQEIASIQSNIAAIATTENEALAIVNILKETNWMPLIEKEQEQARKEQEFWETERELREAYRKAHESDPRRCQYCLKIFPSNQLKKPRLLGKDLRSIPQRHRILCCPNCRKKILKFYVQTCKLCGEQFIASNSQQTCKKCWGKDEGNILQQVKAERNRARKANKLATLTIDEWRATIEHFQGRCAYCQRRPFEVLDHFVPISLKTTNNGTTSDNCVPACTDCNLKKGDIDPNNYSQLYRLYPSITPRDIERVRTYLSSQANPTHTYSISQ